MDEKEQRKADTQLILEGKDAVTRRIVDVFNELFHSDNNAASNLKWLSSQLIYAENPSISRIQSEPLRQYIRKIIQAEVSSMLQKTMREHVHNIEKQTKELNKREKKSWWKR